MGTTSRTAATVSPMPIDRQTAANLKRLGRAVVREEQGRDKAREARDAAIREAAAAGHTVRDIAEHVGISSSAVHKIVRKEAPDD